MFIDVVLEGDSGNFNTITRIIPGSLKNTPTRQEKLVQAGDGAITWKRSTISFDTSTINAAQVRFIIILFIFYIHGCSTQKMILCHGL